MLKIIVDVWPVFEPGRHALRGEPNAADYRQFLARLRRFGRRMLHHPPLHFVSRENVHTARPDIQRLNIRTSLDTTVALFQCALSVCVPKTSSALISR